MSVSISGLRGVRSFIGLFGSMKFLMAFNIDIWFYGVALQSRVFDVVCSTKAMGTSVKKT